MTVLTLLRLQSTLMGLPLRFLGQGYLRKLNVGSNSYTLVTWLLEKLFEAM
jgi:hypothetical protein